MITLCQDVPDQDWVGQRFDGACYFYPRRDCPGWQPGSTCSRIGQVIPQ